MDPTEEFNKGLMDKKEHCKHLLDLLGSLLQIQLLEENIVKQANKCYEIHTVLDEIHEYLRNFLDSYERVKK